MNDLRLAVRNGTMSADRAAERAMQENAYATLHAEYRGEDLDLAWNNGQATGPNAAEFYARLDAHRAIQAAARAIDAQRDAARAAAPRVAVEMVKCACGHIVPRASAMNTSSGTSCPDCYDQMSE